MGRDQIYINRYGVISPCGSEFVIHAKNDHDGRIIFIQQGIETSKVQAAIAFGAISVLVLDYFFIQQHQASRDIAYPVLLMSLVFLCASVIRAAICKVLAVCPVHKKARLSKKIMFLNITFWRGGEFLCDVFAAPTVYRHLKGRMFSGVYVETGDVPFILCSTLSENIYFEFVDELNRLGLGDVREQSDIMFLKAYPIL